MHAHRGALSDDGHHPRTTQRAGKLMLGGRIREGRHVGASVRRGVSDHRVPGRVQTAFERRAGVRRSVGASVGRRARTARDGLTSALTPGSGTGPALRRRQWQAREVRRETAPARARLVATLVPDPAREEWYRTIRTGTAIERALRRCRQGTRVWIAARVARTGWEARSVARAHLRRPAVRPPHLPRSTTLVVVTAVTVAGGHGRALGARWRVRHAVPCPSRAAHPVREGT